MMIAKSLLEIIVVQEEGMNKILGVNVFRGAGGEISLEEATREGGKNANGREL